VLVVVVVLTFLGVRGRQNLGMPFTAGGTVSRGSIVSLTPSGVVAGFGMQL
jgi:hypothetical protein